MVHTEQFQQAFLELAGAAGLNEAALRATLSQELPHATSRWSRRIQDQASICQQDLGLAAGSAAVITNGRVVPVGPGADEGIVAEDFRLMETWAKAHQLSTRVGDSPRFISSNGNCLALWKRSSSPALLRLHHYVYYRLTIILSLAQSNQTKCRAHASNAVCQPLAFQLVGTSLLPCSCCPLLAELRPVDLLEMRTKGNMV